VVTGNVLFLFLPLFFGWKKDWLRRQREDLIKRKFVGDKRSPDQAFPGFPKSGQINLQKGSDAIIVIKTQSVTIRDGDQEEIKKNLDHREIMEETLCYKAVINPTEGAFNLSDSVWVKNFFDTHGPYLLASMIPLSFGQGGLSIEFCISTQGRVLKR
jgi:hypothetical protein